MFGFLAYGNFLLLLIPLYLFYKDPKLSYAKLESAISYLLLFLSILILQALLVKGDHQGFIGATVIEFLIPFVGVAGAWLFWTMTFLVAIVILLDEKINIADLYARLKQWLEDKKGSQKAQKNANEPQETRTASEKKLKDSDDKDGSKSTDVKFDQKSKRVAGVDYSEDAQLPDFDSVQEVDDSVIKLIKSSDYDKSLQEGSKDVGSEKADDTSYQVENSGKKDEPLDEAAQEPTQQKIETTDNKDQSQEQDGATTPSKEYKVVDELEENKKLLNSTVEKGKLEISSDFKLPPLKMLQKAKKDGAKVDENQIDEKVANLLEKLKRFNINGDVVRTYSGPIVTTFEFRPAPNVKVSKILNLQDDLAMALKAKTIRIQAPIPGQDVVGIEIPNESYETIYLRELLESDIFKDSSSPLTLALGKDIVGKPFFTDLKKLPHLLIAGTTGSGKSVGINAMILSLLYRNDPKSLKLMMVDPKMLEFSIYNDIPHLLTPVITEPKKAVNALNNMVAEMERRYKLMSNSKTKNIENYNKKAKSFGYEVLPYIVVVIDELADLMMTAGKDVEYSISRLAQMARASGIHLIVATQRPSVDVVTGLIKANLPSRISYKVGQKVDSKVILDSMGAESLLGRGDMLFTPPGSSTIVRLHAPWSEESEVENIVEFLKDQALAEYDERFLSSDDAAAGEGISGGDLDELYEDAKQVVLSDRKTSISYLQRKLGIGYNRSANIIEQLEAMGVLSSADSRGSREILI